MPLTALTAHGRMLDATTAVWADVYKVRPRAELRCRACGGHMQAKVSKRGLRFFAHDRVSPDCPAAGETPEHRALKALLAAAVRSAGWIASIEVDPGADDAGGWRADVLARDVESARRVALEAQLAPMTVDVGRQRTALYAADQIGVLWATTKDSPWLLRLPGIKVVDDGSGGQVVTRGLARWRDANWRLDVGPIPLARVVAGFLDGRAVERPLRYASEELQRGGRFVHLWHDDAVVVARASDVAAADLFETQQAARLAEAERERQRHAENIRALYARQASLLPVAVEDARSEGGGVWVGVPQRWAPGDRPVHATDAHGDSTTAMGSVVWVGPSATEIRLFAVLSPVASRITPDLAASWRRRQTRIYVAGDDEARRVARALGWPVTALHLVQSS